MVKYDFKISFYNYDRTQYIMFLKPKLVINTEDTKAYVEISINNDYREISGLAYKVANLKIYNVPQTFNENKKLNISFHDAIVIYYKRLAYTRKYHFLLSGLIKTPMDTDYLSRDFSVDYEIVNGVVNDQINHAFLRRQTPKDPTSPLVAKQINFKGQTISEAIKAVCKGRERLKLPDSIANKKITIAFTCGSFDEFQATLSRNYAVYCRREPKEAQNRLEAIYLFYHGDTLSQETSPKAIPIPLEKFGLHFIPQQEIRTTTESRRLQTHWNAQVLYTEKIYLNDIVSFYDRFNNLVTGRVVETSGALSNRGSCVLNLLILDFKKN
ncbi:DUF693 family protein [Candidatus Borreliella tachyglossi]|uniref:DUF693 family protein n=1 Tax=Candidatus Borreliella tachyglossi TaxID=1964448 RepID=UPI004041690C